MQEDTKDTEVHDGFTFLVGKEVKKKIFPNLDKKCGHIFKKYLKIFSYISGVGFPGIFRNLYTNNLRTDMNGCYISICRGDRFVWQYSYNTFS